MHPQPRSVYEARAHKTKLFKFPETKWLPRDKGELEGWYGQSKYCLKNQYMLLSALQQSLNFSFFCSQYFSRLDLFSLDPNFRTSRIFVYGFAVISLSLIWQFTEKHFRNDMVSLALRLVRQSRDTRNLSQSLLEVFMC